MNKIIFGIFAHPDDEAFGPSGALLQEVHSGSKLHLISLTNGDAGTNPDNVKNLGEVRLEEWKKAGELFGATKLYPLGYKDGQLNNQAMIEISQTLITIVSDVLKTAPADAEVEFITLDLNGYTGHIDHIVAARAACFVFYHLKKTDKRLSCIKFACLPKTLHPTPNIDWIFMEEGHDSSEIDEIVDARHFKDEITAIAHAHHSQRNDADYFFKSNGDRLGINYFIIKS